MDTADLPALVARVAALEAIVSAMLSERSSEDIANVLALAQRHIAGINFGDQLLGNGMAFKASITDFIGQIATDGTALARGRR